ncbi:MAG TPA: hypothetical protein VNA20_09740 [Frankiaceae bacterium]|nr:hypothetical protein [Frankiaceae bacterium]
MRMRVVPLLASLVLVAGGAPVSAAPVPGAPACPVFPRDNVWRADVSKLPVHPRSAAWLASSSASTRRLHPDLGSSGDPATPYGIPVHVVSSSHEKVPVEFEYADESDPGPYPLGDDTPIEGGSDRHTVVVDRDTCTLYETWATERTSSGWTAGSGAIWKLTSNAQRPDGWTSADAAGLPILPGLLRIDEVRAGVVDHAIRFTVARTDRSYVWPARHQAGAANDPNLPPMGARFRLKASYDISRFGADTRVVLTAMKKHGLMLADNGSDWYFTGAASNEWPDTFISEMKSVPAGAFEAVDASSLMVSAGSMAAKGAPARRRTPRPGYVPYTPRPPAARTPAPSRPAPSRTTPPPPTTARTSPAEVATTAPGATVSGRAHRRDTAGTDGTPWWPWLAGGAAGTALGLALLQALRRRRA